MTPEDICAEECTVDYDFVPPCDFIPTEDMVCGSGPEILHCLASKWFCDGADAIPDDIDMGQVPYNSASSCAVPGLPTMKSLISQLGAYSNGVADMLESLCEPLSYCDIHLNTGTFSADSTRGDIPGGGRYTIDQFSLPAYDCPVTVFFVCAGYVDLEPDINAGDVFHVNIELAVNTQANVLAWADTYHDQSVANGFTWAQSAPCVAVLSLPAGTPTNILVNVWNDAPIPTINNLVARMSGWWLVVPQ